MFYRRKCWFVGDRRDDWNQKRDGVDANNMVIEERSLQFDCCVLLVFSVGCSCTNDVNSWR